MTDSAEETVAVSQLETLVESWDLWIDDCDNPEAVARMASMKAQLEHLIENHE